MARVSVYIPDELAARARAADINISGLTREAIRSALAGQDTEAWLDRLERLPTSAVDHDQVLTALDGACDGLGA